MYTEAGGGVENAAGVSTALTEQPVGGLPLILAKDRECFAFLGVDTAQHVKKAYLVACFDSYLHVYLGNAIKLYVTSGKCFSLF